MTTRETVLEVRDLTKHFPLGSWLRPRYLRVLEGVSFAIGGVRWWRSWRIGEWEVHCRALDRSLDRADPRRDPAPRARRAEGGTERRVPELPRPSR